MTTLRRTAVAFLACMAVLAVATTMAGAQTGRVPAPTVTHTLPKPSGVPAPALECPGDCSDANPCTTDSCDTTTGFCRHEALSCDDGNPCTHDVCYAFAPFPPGCQHSPLTTTSCSVAGDCLLAGVCDLGVCRAQPASEGSSCDTPSACTEGGVCDAAGHCTPGRPSPVGTPCDDGDPCSNDDACALDESGAPVCRGAARSCDDGDPCTIDSCGTGDSCVHVPVSCEDGNSCTADTCDSHTGACTHSQANEGLECHGPDRCTLATCAAGNCQASGAPGRICDSGTFGCMVGVCNPYREVLCTSVPDSSLCSQNGPCDSYYCDPERHTCQGWGYCHPTPCSVGQCFSRGFCIPTGGTPGASCNDGNTCTINDVCTNGICQGTAGSCDDGDPCTVDSCDPALGCRHVAGPEACDDGDSCTADACAADGSGCLHAAINEGSACDDHDVCTSDTVCTAGVCNGVRTVCDDGDTCTTDTCNPATGCGHSPTVCADDHNPCTRETCDAGVGCVEVPMNGLACNQDGNVCTAGFCTAGACVERPVADGAPCAHIQCVVGTCWAGACALDNGCDDGNSCTTDICSGSVTCQHTNDYEAPCDDRNPCTTDDTCNPAGPGNVACRGTVTPLPVTCGLGVCARTVDTCAGGQPSACIPGAPQAEICNGLDDDCDGQVDENRIMANCMMRPAILYDPSMRSTLAFVCRFRDRCAGNADLPPAGIDPDAVYVTRADRLADPNDNVVAPDPLSLACPDPQQGTAFERGLVETTSARVVGGMAVTLDFTTPHDGVCTTSDGDRTALLERLAATPDGLVSVCVAGRYGGSPWEACALGFLRHRPGAAD